MVIPYKPFKDGELLPFVNFSINGIKRGSVIDAFVDSGADVSILDADLIDFLGLSKKVGSPIQIQVGDGDYIGAYQFHLKIDFYGYRFEAPITFSDQLGSGFNLLGRKGFFDRFRFCFDDKHSRLSVSRL